MNSKNTLINDEVTVIIPTYNAASYLPRLFEALFSQNLHGFEVLVIDSSSTDDTIHICKKFGIEPYSISKKEFDHGGTRTKAAKMAKGEILVFLTQDAIPYDENALCLLVESFADSSVAAAFGRQAPYPGASPLAEHLRLFNYPDRSYCRSLQEAKTFGIKAAFLSNSFAAYRKQALEKIGWFKKRLILSEDTYAGAKILQAGYKIKYTAEAKVYHSHEYTIMQEFNRYFDIGVFYTEENWIIQFFGKPEGEGLRFIASEISFLKKKGQYYLIPASLIRIFVKYLAYQLGRNSNRFPLWLNKRLSMNKSWWDQQKGVLRNSNTP